MKIFKRFTLGDLIDALNALPEGAVVFGFEPGVQSYRGYYNRPAVAPTNIPFDAHNAARFLSEDIGRTMTGYKGGDYEITRDELIYLADFGDTGPNIIGLEPTGEHEITYQPVLLAEDRHY